MLDCRFVDVAGAGPGGQVHRRGIGAVQANDAVDRRGHGSGPLPRCQMMPDRQPPAPLGHADRPDALSHDADPTRHREGGVGTVGGMTSYRQAGAVLTDHLFAVPLDHGRPDGEQIEVFAREVVAADLTDTDLPWLLFLQGGPGFGAQRPQGRDSWLDRALTEYRVLLLDQRGTGRSTPATRQTLAGLGSAKAQADYLTHFRADSIVLDAELIRRQLTGGAPWSVLGQSFGGFCTVTYLSFAPHGIREAFITGGLPGLTATADDQYRITYPQVARRTEAYYRHYPEDVDL